MPGVQFDPFGEPATQHLRHVTGGPRLIQRAGVGMFWGLVVAIVATRAVYFDQGLDDHLRFVASLARSVLSAFS
jgi:hypothetical protein